eukprot:385494-Amphidinium_carterae.1
MCEVCFDALAKLVQAIIGFTARVDRKESTKAYFWLGYAHHNATVAFLAITFHRRSSYGNGIGMVTGKALHNILYVQNRHAM